MIRDIDLDHVAVATEVQAEAWPRYRGELGGSWISGGDSPGFSAAQVKFANGMKVEVLEPLRVEENDFLRRFLDQNGPGPHHLTFKVADIRSALATAEAAGFAPVGVDLSHESWQEAFLHPKQALGVVVQLAQSGDEWESAPPAHLPQPGPAGTATLDHIAHVVADLDAGMSLFGGLLGGTPQAEGRLEGGRYVELGWQGPGRVRLVAPDGDGGKASWAAWLGGRAGRVHHLAFTVTDPSAVAGAEPAGDGTWVVSPEVNLGVRLVLRTA